jgi:hypothetical protein
MPAIKAMDKISGKWSRVTQASTQSYAEGVQNPSRDWATNTAAAEKNFESGVQASISRKAFGKGVKRAGTKKWQDGAIDKGVSRYAVGVALAEAAYQNGFAPYRSVIAALTLPPRGPKGDPSNITRVSIISKALHDEKLKRLGAS